MNYNTELSWGAEKASYARTATALLGRNTQVLDVDPRVADAPGYTGPDGNIHLKKDDSLWEGMEEVEKRAFRKGIFTHEMLHQMFTNFKKAEYIANSIPRRERGIYAELHNLVEDPAIEHFASTVVGEPLTKALNFAIANTYKKTPKLGDIKGAFNQYIAALIMFGDLGVVKGHFTEPKAKEVYKKTLSLFYSGIIEPDGGVRCDIAKKLLNETRELWEPELKKSEEEAKAFMDALKELLKQLGKTESKGSGSGQKPSGSPSESKTDKRQKKLVIKVDKETFDQLKDKLGDGSGNGDGGIQIECDDAGDKKNGSGKSGKSGERSEEKSDDKSAASGNEKSDATDKKSEKESEGNGSDNKGNGEDTDGKTSEKSSSDGKAQSQKNGKTEPGKVRTAANDGDGKVWYDGDDSVETDINGEDTIDDDEYRLTEDDKSYIEAEAEKVTADYEKKMHDESEADAPIEDFEIETLELKGVRVKNHNVIPESDERVDEAYNKLVSSMASEIRGSVTQLKKIFEQDYEDKIHAQGGSLNLLRANSGRVTSRVFDRKRLPNGKRDIAVGIVVDESGSMSSSQKYVAARECCVALAEIFSKLDIPVYVMGFSADEEGYDVIHYHYMKWNNSLSARRALMNISARCCNCDGYSIRYISRVLKKRKETHKLLIVLSDGQPSSRLYNSSRAGVADTKAAIREAKKFSNVLGVAIGNNDTDTINYMYEKNFLHVNEVSDLFGSLAKEIKKIFKYI